MENEKKTKTHSRTLNEKKTDENESLAHNKTNRSAILPLPLQLVI